MISIDGSIGEGGGQVVRSALALAAVTGQSLMIENIRGGRAKPGLLRQHLAGLRAITQICNAETSGDSLGSSTLCFCPKEIAGGDYDFQVGSAGSAVLVAQTILPALMRASQRSAVRIGGGTHAAWAPPFEFFDRCYLPLVNRMGGSVIATIRSHGFYPAGGGEIVLQVEPTTTMSGIDLRHREGELRRRVIALVAQVPGGVAARECRRIERSLAWPSEVSQIVNVQRSGGPGNAVMIECRYDNVTELMVGYGTRGVRAERIAGAVAKEAKRYLSSDAPVGEYLCDQLLLIAGMAAADWSVGGSGATSCFKTGPLSKHSRTQIEILRRFLSIEVRVDERPGGSCEVTVAPAE